MQVSVTRREHSRNQLVHSLFVWVIIVPLKIVLFNSKKCIAHPQKPENCWSKIKVIHKVHIFHDNALLVMYNLILD